MTPPPRLAANFHSSMLFKVAIDGMGCGLGGGSDDLVVFAAGAGGDERADLLARGLKWNKHVVGEGVGLALDIFGHGAGGKERVAVLILVADLAGEVLVKIFAHDRTGCEAIADAGGGIAAGGEDGAVAIDAITDIAADLPSAVLRPCKSRQRGRETV